MPNLPDPHEKLLRLGKIVGFQGLQGAVKVRLYEDTPNWLNTLKTVTLKTPRQTLQLAIRKAKLKAPRQGIFEFEGYTDRTGAEKDLTGGELFAPMAQLPKPAESEYWVDDLIGLKVLDVDTGEELGQVKDLLSSTGSDYLEISVSGGETVVVPFVDEFFPVVEPQTGQISIHRLAEFLREAAQSQQSANKP